MTGSHTKTPPAAEDRSVPLIKGTMPLYSEKRDNGQAGDLAPGSAQEFTRA